MTQVISSLLFSGSAFLCLKAASTTTGMQGSSLLFLFTTVVLLVHSAGHRYNVGDQVPLYVNKVGPLNNPSETYEYYDLPFCRPDPLIKKKETLGEVLNGDRLANALYTMKFREGKNGETLCQKKFSARQVAMLRDAVINDYYFQMYYDDLPLWGFIGKVDDESWNHRRKGPKYYLFRHVQIDILYNGDQVTEAHAFSDPYFVVDITEDHEVDVKFTYSVIWNTTKAHFGNRMDLYLGATLQPRSQKLHWFSFINSIVIIMLLMAFLVLLYVKRLNHDLRKYSNADDEENKDLSSRQSHNAAFRNPSNKSLFCAFIGTGIQLLIIVCVLFSLAFCHILYPYNRGTLSACVVLAYAVSSTIAGFSAASLHFQLSQNKWENTVVLAGVIYSGPVFVAVFVLNKVAVGYGATAALPFGTIAVILFIYVFLTIPLLALGGIIGFRFNSGFQASYLMKRYPRETLRYTWYRKTPSLMFVGGLLPFSAIAPELHNVYASMWSYKIYTLPGILFVTFISIILITALLSIILTYIQLSEEDHEWWWRSFLCGGSTAIFMFGYSIFFYSRSNMSGLLQLSFFVGYNACLCYGIFIMLGSVGFLASLWFVRYMNRAAKSE